MYLRQVALVAQNLNEVRQQFFALLGLEEAFVDEVVAEFGLRNIVMPIGQTFLEVVSPQEEGTTAGRLLQRRGGDGGYMVLVQADDFARERRRIDASAIEVVWEVDTGKAQGMHLHPRDVPGAITSIDQMTPPEAWYWAGPDWASRAARHATQITAVEIQSSKPTEVAECWARAFDRPLLREGDALALQLDRGHVRFVLEGDGRGDGLRALDIQVPDVQLLINNAEQLSLPVSDSSVTICGTVLNFVGPG